MSPWNGLNVKPTSLWFYHTEWRQLAYPCMLLRCRWLCNLAGLCSRLALYIIAYDFTFMSFTCWVHIHRPTNEWVRLAHLIDLFKCHMPHLFVFSSEHVWFSTVTGLRSWCLWSAYPISEAPLDFREAQTSTLNALKDHSWNVKINHHKSLSCFYKCIQNDQTPTWFLHI